MRKLSLACFSIFAASCGLGASRDSGTVSIALPLSVADCDRMQDTTRGGAAMDATFVAVAGAEFPPITEIRRGEYPCAAPGDQTGVVSEVTVHVPSGDKRVIALAVLGAPLLAGVDFSVPDGLDIHGLPLRQQTPRVVFFGGGTDIDKVILHGGSLNLTVYPFVNLLGAVRSGGAAAQAKVSFYRPQLAGDCLQFEDDPAQAVVQFLYATNTSERGLFFAPVPYQATAGTGCDFVDEPNNNEAFAFAESADGTKFALFVPGRAMDRGTGLEPGMLLDETVLFLRDPSESGPLVTGMTRIPDPDDLVLAISGYGLPERTVALKVKIESGSLSSAPPVTVDKAGPLGDGIGSYDAFRRFGDRAPSSLVLRVGGVLTLVPRGQTVHVSGIGPTGGELPLDFTFTVPRQP